MTGDTPTPSGSRVRALGWAAAALVLLGPLAAMQFTDEVRWSVGDFVMFGGLLAVAGGAIELAVRLAKSRRQRLALVAAIAVTFLLVWIELAVGLFGPG